MKRRPEPPEKDEFIVLFTALSMILLAFFIMLNSLAVIDSGRSRKAMNSLIGTFGIMPGGSSSKPGSIDSTTMPKRQKTTEALTSDIEKGVHRGMHLRSKGDGRAVVELEGSVAFSPGSWRLNPDFFTQLDLLADMIRGCKCTVEVTGHSDAKKPKSGKSNFYLSAARASSVRTFLIEATSLEARLFQARGVASNQLHPKWKTQPSHPRHRRVEVTLVYNKEAKSRTTPDWIEPIHETK